MNQRGTSILLIPLLAVLALFFPLTTHQPSAGTTSKAPPRTSSPKPTPQKKGRGQENGGKCRGGTKCVRDFLGISGDEKRSWPKGDSRSKNVIGFLVATVPDPIDSGLPYLFDRFLDSVQAALQSQGYVLYGFDLPWEDCLLGRNHSGEGYSQDSDSGRALDDRCKEKGKGRHETEPGVILMSKAGAKQDLDAKLNGTADPDVLLLYLIGETPTSGIHKPALKAALDDLEAETARRGIQLTGSSNGNILHTLACVYAEAGRTREAREMMLQAMNAMNLEEPNGLIWYIVGRLAEQYALNDAAAKAYQRVEAPDTKLRLPLSTYALAQRRLKALGVTKAASVN